MKKIVKILLVTGLVSVLSACSASQVDDESMDQAALEEGLDEGAIDGVADAGTDAVPVDQLEETKKAMDDTAFAEEPVPPKQDIQPPKEPVESAQVQAEPQREEPTPPTMPEVPPAPQVDHSSFAGTSEHESYSVQRGDTLMKIAFEHYGDVYQWRKIYELNRDKISDLNRLVVGNVFKIEKPHTPVAIERNGEPYLIKFGDTLGTISDDVYGTQRKWKRLWENNKQLIKDPNRIYAGFYLYYTMTQQDTQEKKQFDEISQKPLAKQKLQPPQAAAVPVEAPTMAKPTLIDPGFNNNQRMPASNKEPPVRRDVKPIQIQPGK